jgi:hypothetical protein
MTFAIKKYYILAILQDSIIAPKIESRKQKSSNILMQMPLLLL